MLLWNKSISQGRVNQQLAKIVYSLNYDNDLVSDINMKYVRKSYRLLYIIELCFCLVIISFVV